MLRLVVVFLVVALGSMAHAEEQTAHEQAASLDKQADGYRNAAIVLVGLGTAGIIAGRVVKAKYGDQKNSDGYLEATDAYVLSATATGTGIVFGAISLVYIARSLRLRERARTLRNSTVSVAPLEGGAMAQFSTSF